MLMLTYFGNFASGSNNFFRDKIRVLYSLTKIKERCALALLTTMQSSWMYHQAMLKDALHMKHGSELYLVCGSGRERRLLGGCTFASLGDKAMEGGFHARV